MRKAKSRSIIRKAKSRINPYAQILRAAVQDENLTLKARGLLAYLLSLPDNWEIHFKELAAHFKKDGSTSIRTALNELKAMGYVNGQTIREGTKIVGYEYLVFEEPGLKRRFEETLEDNEAGPGSFRGVQEEMNRKEMESLGLPYSVNSSAVEEDAR